jgi:hypothetical protein
MTDSRYTVPVAPDVLAKHARFGSDGSPRVLGLGDDSPGTGS